MRNYVYIHFLFCLFIENAPRASTAAPFLSGPLQKKILEEICWQPLKLTPNLSIKSLKYCESHKKISENINIEVSKFDMGQLDTIFTHAPSIAQQGQRIYPVHCARKAATVPNSKRGRHAGQISRCKRFAHPLCSRCGKQAASLNSS